MGKKKRRKEKRILAYIDGSGLGMYGYCMPKEKIRVLTMDHPMTNNRAEYLALYRLLLDADFNSKLDVKSDSQLVVNQFRGEWKTNNSELKRIGNLCKQIVRLKNLDINISWVPRELNTFGKFLDREKEKKKRQRKRLYKMLERGYLN